MSDYMEDWESNRIKEIISRLPEEDRELFKRQRETLLANSRRAALAAIMVRNFSHNLGAHCFKTIK